MARKIIFSVLSLALAASAWANDPANPAKDSGEKLTSAFAPHDFGLESDSMVDQVQDVSALRATILDPVGATFNSVTEEDVGDVDSFKKNKIYLGVEQTQPVFIDTDCSAYGPDDICYELDPVTRSVNVNESDLGSITLPKNSSKSLLCFTFTQFATWLWTNPTGGLVTGDMSMFTTVQIESEFLNGLTDADGNPFNGQLWPNPLPIVVAMHQDSLPDGAFEIERERVTRSCTAGLVNKRSLMARGLTDKQAKDFFKKKDITITFGTAGNASHTDIATYFNGIRIYGDK